MNENLSEAFIILAVGMITVFTILTLVVITGKVLINITNRYAPPVPIKSLQKTAIENTSIRLPKGEKNSTLFDKKKLAAIVGVVEHITQGKGQIEKIEKI